MFVGIFTFKFVNEYINNMNRLTQYNGIPNELVLYILVAEKTELITNTVANIRFDL